MNDSRAKANCVPDITEIKQKCSRGHIKWSTHVMSRMQERNIEPSDVTYCINNGVMIEQYPQAYPYPACLILGLKEDDKPIHVVVGLGCDFAWIITVYEPNEGEWTKGFSERKRE